MDRRNSFTRVIDINWNNRARENLFGIVLQVKESRVLLLIFFEEGSSSADRSRPEDSLATRVRVAESRFVEIRSPASRYEIQTLSSSSSAQVYIEIPRVIFLVGEEREKERDPEKRARGEKKSPEEIYDHRRGSRRRAAARDLDEEAARSAVAPLSYGPSLRGTALMSRSDYQQYEICNGKILGCIYGTLVRSRDNRE